MKDPIDYYLDYNTKDTVLTLHFTLPLKTPVKAKELNVEIYDPEYFVDFSFKDVKDPISLVGAPAACKLIGGPAEGIDGRARPAAERGLLQSAQRRAKLGRAIRQ